jgi:arsenate reductase
MEPRPLQEDRIRNVLVLCTGNSARSIMAEALVDVLGRGRLRAFSAGSRPAGRVHPFAIEQLRAIGYPVEGLRSKSWDEFAAPGAPRMDVVVTVCDRAAAEACPHWPGTPLTAHWSFEDPAAAPGGDAHRRRAFARVFGQIRDRVQAFVDLPLHDLDRAAIQAQLDRLGADGP